MKVTLQGKLIVIHGPAGIGKTQLASKFPGPHQWFATEPGQSYIPDKQQASLIELPPEPESWTSFIKGAKELRKVRTAVVDTIGGVFDICQQWTCKKNGWDHPSDAPMGKGWSAYRTKLGFRPPMKTKEEAAEEKAAKKSEESAGDGE